MNLEEEKLLLLRSFLEISAVQGWNNNSFLIASKQSFGDEHYGYILFPGMEKEIVGYFSHMIDQQMNNILESSDIDCIGITDTIKQLVMIRIKLYEPYKDSIRSLIQSSFKIEMMRASTKLLWSTVSNIWYLAGDSSTDYNYYSKRALLSCVYFRTLLYWLNDNSNEYQETYEYLSQRVAEILQLRNFKNQIYSIKDKMTKLPFIRLWWNRNEDDQDINFN